MSTSKFRRTLAALLVLVATQTGAVCSNPLTSFYGATHLVVAENGKGCWAAWPNDARNGVCLAVAVKDKCNSATARKAVAAWVTDRNASFTVFGTNPTEDPVLLAEWKPDAAKIDALKASLK